MIIALIVVLQFEYLLVLCGPSIDVANGTVAVPHSHPYLAYITARTKGFSGVWYCAGTLISPNYVLTSAGCLDEASYINITLGLQTVSNASNEGTLLTSTSKDITHHSRYTKGYLYGNIALVKLSKTLNLNITGDNIKVAKLANESYIDETFVKRIGDISGWGFTDPFNRSQSDVLIDGSVEVISTDDCMTNQGYYFDNTIICTKQYKGTPCLWDEGGPLVVDGMVIGVIFNTPINCLEPNSTTLYTRVPNYLDWIRKNSDVVDND